MIDPTALVAPKGYAPTSGQTTYGAARHGADAWRRLTGGPPVEDSEDLRRVVALPRRPREEEDTDRGEALIDAETARYALPGVTSCRCAEIDAERHAAEGCVTRLRLAQAWALREIRIVGGLLGPIGVGHGKTLLDVLAPLALAHHGCRVVLLLVPPGLITQLIGDYEYAAQHFVVPGMVVHGGDYTSVIAGRPTLHVLPYSRLQRPEATAWLEHNLRPDAIVADEAHKLRDLDRAGASRVKRYMEDHTTTAFCAWSGTLTEKRIADYAHLARWALRLRSPVPVDGIAADDWGRTIDSGCDADPGALLDALRAHGLIEPGEHVREGFQRRLTETLGVVSTRAPAVKARLEIERRDPIFAGRPIVCVDEPGEDEPLDEGLPPEVRRMLQDLRATWTRPDGEELTDALQLASVARQLACGFYYYWIFPHNELPRDEPLIGEWLDARRHFHKELRRKLGAREEHLDSPLLCQHAAERHWGDRPRNKGLPTWHSVTWPRWRDVRGKVRPETRAHRVHDFLARDALAWAREHRGIVWYDHGEFGRWVAELSARDGGSPLPLHGGGPSAGKLIKAERGDRSIVASIKSHGTGRNGLQHVFGDQLVEHVPPMGAEQLLGRLHRAGQPRPVVRTWFYAHTVEMLRQLFDALDASSYVAQTTGAAQKLRDGLGAGNSG